jgi:hypothetical protein
MLVVCIRRPAWSEMAFTRVGCEWPMQQTAQPAIRSRYSRPSASRRREPRPSTSTTGSRFTTGRKWVASRSRADSTFSMGSLLGSSSRASPPGGPPAAAAPTQI